MKKKVAIFIPSYRAVKTLISAIERIPKNFKNKYVSEIYVIDDFSDDNTYFAGLGYKYLTNSKILNIYKNEKNLGYGGNQKKGYDYAIKKDYDVVVMLHGDVQYAPEEIPRLVKPIIDGKADMVFGSRIKGHPIKGGMPIWKFLGNKFLTFAENKVLKTNLSEFHSGFRAYNCTALKEIPYHFCSDGYNFDTDIIIQFVEKGFNIGEILIPTHYGPESHKISFMKAFIYGFSILKSLYQYRLFKKNRRYYKKFDIKRKYS